jgi:DNA polymerase-3 subunit alpha
MLTRVRPTVTKSGRNPGQKMAMITLEDLTGTCDGVIFPNDLAKAKDLVVQDKMVFLRGRCDRGRETPSIVVSDVVAIEQAAEKLASMMVVSLNSAGTAQQTLVDLAKAIESHRGPVPICFSLATVRPGGGAGSQPIVVRMRPDPRFNVRPAASLLHQIEQLLGPGHVRIVGPKRRPQKPVPATEVSAGGIAPAADASAAPAPPTVTADRLKEFAPAGDHIDDAIDADE